MSVKLSQIMLFKTLIRINECLFKLKDVDVVDNLFNY